MLLLYSKLFLKVVLKLSFVFVNSGFLVINLLWWLTAGGCLKEFCSCGCTMLAFVRPLRIIKFVWSVCVMTFKWYLTFCFYWDKDTARSMIIFWQCQSLTMIKYDHLQLSSSCQVFSYWQFIRPHLLIFLIFFNVFFH